MRTSYFGNPILKNYPKHQLVSVAMKTPDDEIRVYQPVCPPYHLVHDYKAGILTEQKYIEIYLHILDALDPRIVYKEIGEDSIILCYEKPDKFCHRHILAKWLSTNLKIEILEL